MAYTPPASFAKKNPKDFDKDEQQNEPKKKWNVGEYMRKKKEERLKREAELRDKELPDFDTDDEDTKELKERIDIEPEKRMQNKTLNGNGIDKNMYAVFGKIMWNLKDVDDLELNMSIGDFKELIKGLKQ